MRRLRDASEMHPCRLGMEPEIKQTRFSTIVEETISINPDDFLHADRNLEYTYFGLAPIQKVKQIVTAIQMFLYNLNVPIFPKNLNRR